MAARATPKRSIPVRAAALAALAAAALAHPAEPGAGRAEVAPGALDLPASFRDAVPLIEQESGQYYVRGRIDGGIETDFLVDTGASYVALSQATFERVRAGSRTAVVRQIVGVTADGRRRRVPIHRVAEIAIGECRIGDVEVAVLRSADRDILGLSALRRVEPFALTLSPPRLWLSDCDGRRL